MSLETLLEEARDDYRNTLLDALDALHLRLRSDPAFDMHELNAVNSAGFELALEWGMKGWKRDRRKDA